MKDQLKSRERQPCVEPTDPLEMLLYKESLDKGSKSNIRYGRHGPLRSLLEAARASLARWRLATRIWLHRLSARVLIIAARVVNRARAVPDERPGPTRPDKTPPLAHPPEQAADGEPQPFRRG